MRQTSAAQGLGPPAQVLSIYPVTLPAPGRPVELQVRVSAPVSGGRLPIILLSHGHGPSNFVSSLHGYAPLANYYAAYGFVVLQPTHLDSKTLPFRSSNHPDAPLFWRSRVEDMKRILDQLDRLERAVPVIGGRVDRSRVGVVGHSLGGHTASLLLGAHHRASRGDGESRLAEPRIQAGVLLAAPGRGDALSARAARNYPFFSSLDFSSMSTPALVVAGDKDASAELTTAGAAWHADPHFLSPGPKSLVTLFDAEHGLGGVAGYDLAETTDENPARVAVVQRLSWAYLKSQLYSGDTAWQEAQATLTDRADALGRVESK